MERMKTLSKYVICIILFFIFSEIMIKINIETTYQDIERKDNQNQITISQAQATKINGRIKGAINNNENNKIINKYIKIDLYSKRNTYLGSKYIDISTIKVNETKEFEIYFKIQDVEYYEIKFTDEKEEGELPEMTRDLTKNELLMGTFLTFLIFW